MSLYTESVVDQTDHFPDTFAHENVAHGYNVVTFESLQLTLFCLKKRDIVMI